MMMSRSDPGKSSATFAMKRSAAGESFAPIGRTSGRSDCLIVIRLWHSLPQEVGDDLVHQDWVASGKLALGIDEFVKLFEEVL